MRLIEQLRWWAKECDRTNFGCQARKLLLEAADALEKVPTIDAVPVTRCVECKHSREKNEDERKYLIEGVLICTSPDASDECWNPVFENHFCSYGERKE